MQIKDIRHSVPESFPPIRQPSVSYLGYVLAAMLCIIIIQLTLLLFAPLSESISQSVPRGPYMTPEINIEVGVATLFGIAASLGVTLALGLIMLAIHVVRHLRSQR